MKSLSLYDMSKEMTELLEADEINDEILAAAIGNIETKSENVCHFVRNMEGVVATFKDEEKRISSRRKAYENAITRVKEYTKLCMEMMGAEKISAGTFTLGIQNNPPALEVTDETLIPNKYRILVPERWELDKDGIKSDLKAGVEIPGAMLTVGRSLRIR